MSTNYYFRDKQSLIDSHSHNQKVYNLFKQFEQNLYNIGAEVDAAYYKLQEANWMLYKEPKTLHIGKRSAGWRPLFQMQDEFKSITEMTEWYSSNKDDYEIIDEYGATYTWDQLENELIKWNKENPDATSHIEYMNKHDFTYSNRYFEIEGYEWYDGEFS